MPSLRDLKRRIKSISSTQQITKAMKAVSAAKMQKSQDQVISARPYARRIKNVLARISSHAEGSKLSIPSVKEKQDAVFVIVTADRGLCGGFNGNLIRRAMQEIKKFPKVGLICIGRKGRDFFRRRGYHIEKEFLGLGETIQFKKAQEIARLIIQKCMSGEFGTVYIMYSEFVNVLVQKPIMLKLWPIEAESGEGGAKEKNLDYIFEPSAEEVLAELLPLYLENAVFHALLESKAGEHSARMTAMDSATRNAGDMIDSLTLAMNRARQTAITKEITEIVGGAAALE